MAGKMVDKDGKVTINSPETMKAIEYAQRALQDLHARHRGLARRQQQPRLPRRRSCRCIANGVSAYYAAKNDPALAEIAADIRTTNLADRPGAASTVELYQVTSAVIFKYTKYPKAATRLSAIHVRAAADGRLDRSLQPAIAARP